MKSSFVFHMHGSTYSEQLINREHLHHGSIKDFSIKLIELDRIALTIVWNPKLIDTLFRRQLFSFQPKIYISGICLTRNEVWTNYFKKSLMDSCETDIMKFWWITKGKCYFGYQNEVFNNLPAKERERNRNIYKKIMPKW